MSAHSSTTASLQDKADEAVSGLQQSGAREQLTSWIMEHVDEWERWRKQHYDARWAVYLRKWRGLWSEEDRTRGSERSRLVAPALQQAVEEAVAEIEEALLSDKEAWFDIDNDRGDRRFGPEHYQAVRLQLLDDMDYANVNGALLESAGLMGAVYGTAIGKIVVDVHPERRLKTVLDPKKKTIVDGVQETDKVAVFLEPVRPDQFVIDTAVNKPGREGIEQALGMAHVLPRPRHTLRARMENGDYWEVPLDGGEATNQQGLATEVGVLRTSDAEDANLLVEYHGLVPKALLEAAIDDKESVDKIDSREMVESVCTIIDRHWLVAARQNENLKQDRDFIAAPYDLIPGSFWGRGICEKGINSQNALDAMLRGQIDGLAYTVHPMLGVNSQRRDPRHKIEVGPGKTVYVNGDPREALFPLNFGRMDPTTFNASGMMERLIQTATGTGGSSMPAGARGSATVGVASMVQGAMAKRGKRTLRLLERHFLIPLVEKFCLRHMQWNEEVYPFVDLRFRVRTATSLVAREVENQNLAQVLQAVPPASPVFYAILGQIIENSSAKDKGMVMALIQATIQGQLPRSENDQQQPDPIERERQAADLEEVRARTRMKEASTAKTIVDIQAAVRDEAGGRKGSKKGEAGE